MKELPWQDICSSDAWAESVKKLTSMKSKSRGRSFLSSLFRAKLPREITEMTQLIENYHSMEKRSLHNIDARQPVLWGIARTGQRYLDKYKVTGKGVDKEAIYAKVLGNDNFFKNKKMGAILYKTESDFGGKTGAMPTPAQSTQIKQEIRSSHAQAQYNEAKLKSFDYAVAKVARRGAR